MSNIKKLLAEHRKGYSEIIKIEQSQEGLSEKASKITLLYTEELLPHFKAEEEGILKDPGDDEGKRLLAEHDAVADLISDIKEQPTQELIDRFVELMKDHIRAEDIYFAKAQPSWQVPVTITAVMILLILLARHN